MKQVAEFGEIPCNIVIFKYILEHLDSHRLEIPLLFESKLVNAILLLYAVLFEWRQIYDGFIQAAQIIVIKIQILALLRSN